MRTIWVTQGGNGLMSQIRVGPKLTRNFRSAAEGYLSHAIMSVNKPKSPQGDMSQDGNLGVE
jgi:hypothetical protein